MPKNEFAKRQYAVKQAMLDVGMDTGFQKCWDLIQICLRDPEAVGKDIFGKERIKRLYDALMKHEKELGGAWLPSVEKEADVKQRDLDAALGEIWGEELCPFDRRYPQLKKADYAKGKKNWR
jgi:hypothetical protein